MQFHVDGRPVDVADTWPGGSLLDVLREHAGVTSVKDGCSPQGQCGCCTVLVDGAPRVACVTPAARVAGRPITTLDGLAPERRRSWAAAMTATGASQCGFCTPGIVVRLEALRTKGIPAGDRRPVDQALLAHLCRCTGWQTIREAYDLVAEGDAGERPVPAGAARDLAAAARRAGLEGGVAQRVGPDVVLGRAGFADDTAPRSALAAVPSAEGGWAVAATPAEARRVAAKVQGRRSTAPLRWPVEAAPGRWDLVLRTTWVEPAYLEPDASWSDPASGRAPASPLANGGAFGAKEASPLPAAAAELAHRHGTAVRVTWAREDIVRRGPKRPPMAFAVRADGTGVVRVVRTAGIVEAIHRALPGVDVLEVDVAGPPTSARLRAAGWAEAAVVRAVLARTRGASCDEPVAVVAPGGGRAEVAVGPDGAVSVRVAAGEVLDEVVLRSYCIGAVHQALGWVTSEAIAVDDDGIPLDLTIRSFGILRAADMPEVRVHVEPATPGAAPEAPVAVSDAVLAATAAAVWLRRGLPDAWPTDRR